MSEPFLKREDYEEPTCLLCMDKNGGAPKQIPVDRVIAKFDSYVESGDTEGALRHLGYWYEEARIGRDEGGMLTILNEKMGLLRKEGRHQEAVETAERALKLASSMQLDGETVLGTTFLNAGTVFNAAGMPEKALPFYESAQKIYEANLDAHDSRLGGLYNNMAVTLMHLGIHERAESCYTKALDVMIGSVHECLERAVTYVNMANLYEAMLGPEQGETKISECLRNAQNLLSDPSVRQDAYAAFVYEKCAPAFGYFGWFACEQTLVERARKIHEGT